MAEGVEHEGVWFHFVFTGTRTTWKVYINGERFL
jgi:hypothetical protein